jgi:PAS domain S-box-containing protein
MALKTHYDDSPASLESVICTDELGRRAARAPRNDILLGLARSLADSPRSVLNDLIDTALKLCGGGSAGICLLDEEDGRKVCRCHAASGEWASMAGSTIPYESTPCGVVIEREATQLFSHPHRHFQKTKDRTPPAAEALYTPFRVGGRTIGTAWVVTHSDCCSFDAEDARVLESLANFASMAYQISTSLEALEKQRDALSESEQRFRLMADSSPFIIWVSDAQSNLVFINDAYRRFFGVTEEQVLQQGWQALLHPDDLEGHNSSYLAALEARAPWTYQVRVRRFDGEWRWVESRSNPRFSSSGEYLGAVGSSPDITEQKLRREQLEAMVAERTRELERSHQVQRRTETMAVIGALSGGIAHDLGNLLLPLDCHVECLEHLALPEESRVHIEALGSAAAYLRTLNNRLRLYLRGDAGGEAGAELVRLDRWHREIESFLRTIVPEDVTFECHIPPGLPPISANKAALTQAVYNLIQNGVQAISEQRSGGSVVVRCTALDETVHITVEDDGPGMPPEVQEKCLEPFFTSRGARGGTGLGLSLVRGFVRSVGGTIEIQSPLKVHGRGTAFVLSIPGVASTPARPSKVRTTSRSAAAV